jgi:hypothetical protein
MIPTAINDHHRASKARALPWTRKGQPALDPWSACGAGFDDRVEAQLSRLD